MKHRTVRMLVLALLSSATLLAQGGRLGSRPGRQNRIDFLATVLNLGDDQKQQASTIFAAAEQASSSLRDTLKQQRQALNDAAKTNAAEAEIDQLAAALGDLTGKLSAIHTKAFAKFYALLNTEQQTKLNQLQANGRGMMGSGLPFGSAGPLP